MILNQRVGVCKSRCITARSEAAACVDMAPDVVGWPSELLLMAFLGYNLLLEEEAILAS